MARLHISEDEYGRLMEHLFPVDDPENEQCAFLFACLRPGEGADLDVVETLLVPPTGFEAQSADYVELNDEIRSGVIKRAHDLRCGLVEVHTHPTWWPARFSYSDLSGLDEFVPHVMRRLPGRPYVAIVVTPRDFDALVWKAPKSPPVRLEFLEVGSRRLPPTGLSLAREEDLHHEPL